MGVNKKIPTINTCSIWLTYCVECVMFNFGAHWFNLNSYSLFCITAVSLKPLLLMRWSLDRYLWVAWIAARQGSHYKPWKTFSCDTSSVLQENRQLVYTNFAFWRLCGVRDWTGTATFPASNSTSTGMPGLKWYENAVLRIPVRFILSCLSLLRSSMSKQR